MKTKITQDVICNKWIAQHPEICFDSGSQRYRQYKDGRWVEMEDAAVQLTIIELLSSLKPSGIKPSKNLVISVEFLIKLTIGVSKDRWNANPNLIVMRNGTICLSEDGSDCEFITHSDKHYMTRRIDALYDPTAAAPNFMSILNAAVDPDSLSMLQEFIGYCLTTDTRYQVMLWIEGAPATGKTTFLDAVVGMLGELAAIVPIAATVQRFGLSNIEGRTLLYSDNQTLSYLPKASVMNQLVDGEYIEIKEKYRAKGNVRAVGKVLWVMNEKPAIKGSETHNIGIWRRLKLLKFVKNYGALDPHLKKRVAEEKAGMVNWALAGLSRLRARGTWKDSKESIEMVAEYRGEEFTIGQ